VSKTEVFRRDPDFPEQPLMHKPFEKWATVIQLKVVRKNEPTVIHLPRKVVAAKEEDDDV
jgi:hypothetical protein